MIEEKKRQEEEGKRGAWNEVEIGEFDVHVCLSVPVCVHVYCIVIKRLTFCVLASYTHQSCNNVKVINIKCFWLSYLFIDFYR